MGRAIVVTIAIIGGLMLIPSKSWSAPERARPYLSTVYDAERAHNLPQNLLARVLYQESRYRPDIIQGETRSSAGAVGIAQIVPKWHPGVDPTDPEASIWYAAQYLRRLHDRFGTWAQALAAYNWGQGNVSSALDAHGQDWFAHAPKETRDYVTEVTADVGGLS